MSNLNSFVVWLADGRYSIAWGTSPDDAKAKYLTNWANSVTVVESTAKFRNPLPLERQVAIAGPCVWGDEVPLTIHQPLPSVVPKPPALSNEEATVELSAQVAALAAQVSMLTRRPRKKVTK